MLIREIRFWSMAVVGYFLFHSFAYAFYHTPTESMVPTIQVGDRMVVSKWAYGFGRYSSMFLDLPIEERVLTRPVERGEIAVFRLPSDVSQEYIKRILAVPGDEIMFRGGIAYINGERVQRQRISDFSWTSPSGRSQRVARFEETLPNGKRYMVLDWGVGSRSDDFGPVVVPEGHYFAVGDNRDNSLDSRFPSPFGVGFVPAENLVGRAEVITWSWSGAAAWNKPWTWHQAFRGNRALVSLR